MAKKIDMEKSHVYVDWKDIKSMNVRGYFFDVPDSWVINTLVGARNDSEYNVFMTPTGGWWRYFVPADLVVFEDELDTKDYRPFFGVADLPFRLGDKIIYRHKDLLHPCKAIVTSIETVEVGNSELQSISLGSFDYEPEELFMGYELYNESTNTWEPFGVKLQVVDVRDLKGNK